MIKKWNVIIMADMCPYQNGTFDTDLCLYNDENRPMDCNINNCPVCLDKLNKKISELEQQLKYKEENMDIAMETANIEVEKRDDEIINLKEQIASFESQIRKGEINESR